MKCTKSAVLLLALLVAASTFSCGETAAPVTTDAVTTTAPATETEADKINWESSGLPEKDFGGREFTVLTAEVDSTNYTWHMVAPEEQNGETLNDEMYDRNKKIEEIYNITISSVYTASMKNDATNSINAGDDMYSLIFSKIYETYPMAQEGQLYNLYKLDYVNLDADWWDQSMLRDLSYHDAIYHMTGDISPSTDARVFVLIFNKDLCQSLNLEYPYQDVLDNKWTLDRFKEYITDVNHDVNGDSQMDFEDRWGFLSQNGFSWMMYLSGGGQIVDKDQNGDLYVAYNTERNVRLATAALDIAIDKSTTLMADPYVTANGGSWPAVTTWFANGGALFRSTTLEPVPRDLRALDVNFGILPFPMLDETQGRYYTLTEEYSRAFSVPVTADMEMVGLVLESLAVESVEGVKPAFYDVVLNGKVVRDDESKEMLDIIFANKIFDIGLFGDIAGFRNMLKNLETRGSTDVVSSYASSLSVAETQLEKICENFDGLE